MTETMHLRAAAGRGAPRARPRLLARSAAALALAVLAGGCATKRDVRDIRTDMTRLEARQDSIFRLLQMQNREILDSLTLTTERLLNVRGELANQLQGLNDQLVQVGELTSQVQIRLNQLDQQLTAAVNHVGAAGLAPTEQGESGAAGGATGDAGGGNAMTPTDMARQFYEIGLEQIDRGNAQTARNAFQMVVDSFPSDPVAADAQRQIGETYVLEKDYDEALKAFDRVVERYQSSDAAPRALYRAGVIARERGNTEKARQYFQRVISGYPNSDARRMAEEALKNPG